MFDNLKKLAAGGDTPNQVSSDGRYEIASEQSSGADRLIEQGELGVRIDSQVAPQSAVYDRNYFTLNDKYCRLFYLREWPVRVEPNWLGDLFSWPDTVDVSLHYRPIPIDKYLKDLQTKVAREKSEIENDARVGNRTDHERIQRLESAEGLQKLLEQRRTKPFNVTLIVWVRCDTPKELDETCEAIQGQLKGMGAELVVADLRQRDAMLAAMPFGRNYISDGLGTSRAMQTEGAAYTFPFTVGGLSMPDGLWFGIDRMSNSNVLIDRWRLNSPHMLVVGDTGSGKSYGCKQLEIRTMFDRTPLIVIDPDGEQKRMCEKLGGQFITIGPNSPDRLNPMDFSHIADGEEDHLTAKILSVLQLISSMRRGDGEATSGLSSEQYEQMQNLLSDLYAEFGYTTDPRTQHPSRVSPQSMPTLSDLRSKMEQTLNANEHNTYIVGLLRPILGSMGPYVGQGVFAPLFDNHTTVELRSEYVVFNIRPISSTGNQTLMALGMHSVLEFLWTTTMNERAKQQHPRRTLWIDEANVLLRQPETGEFTENLLRRARKFGVGICLMTQSPRDFVRDDRPWGRNIFNATSLQLVLRLKREDAQGLQGMLGLNDEEVELIATRGNGEGLLFVMDDRAFIDMRTSSPKENELITTNPQEIAAIEARERAEMEQMMALQQGPVLELPAGTPPGNGPSSSGPLQLPPPL